MITRICPQCGGRPHLQLGGVCICCLGSGRIANPKPKPKPLTDESSDHRLEE